MTALEWDKVGERFYQTGIDRGVLFTTDGDAYTWNGLTQINEDESREVKSYYIDGIKYLDHHVPGSYSAKLEAFTYPDILDELTGVAQYVPGVFLHDQPSRVFHLCYRTGVGNDLDPDLGYKIHIVYNVMAVPSGAEMATLSNSVDPGKFSWALTGTPPAIFGARPTSHISIQSLHLDPALLEILEEQIYGTSSSDPNLPSMEALLALLDPS